MWFTDTNHPNFLVRFIARLVWTIIGAITLAVLVVVGVWMYNKFSGNNLYDQIRHAVPWMFDGGWKRPVAVIIGGIILFPIAMDMLFGDSGYNNGRMTYNDNRRFVNRNDRNRNNSDYRDR